MTGCMLELVHILPCPAVAVPRALPKQTNKPTHQHFIQPRPKTTPSPTRCSASLTTHAIHTTICLVYATTAPPKCPPLIPHPAQAQTPQPPSLACPPASASHPANGHDFPNPDDQLSPPNPSATPSPPAPPQTQHSGGDRAHKTPPPTRPCCRCFHSHHLTYQR